MKRILITGKGSYIGQSFKRYMSGSDWVIDELDVRDEAWKSYDFSQYDVVFHVAGIAHVLSNTQANEELYYNVNTRLTKKVAEKSKFSGIKQFIFMSSAIVYGDTMNYLTDGLITEKTAPKPTNYYGDSKLQAEYALKELEKDDTFKIVILRPPMIYGPNSKGNYPRLSKLAQNLPVFPRVSNSRSMLFIDNLCEFIRLMIVHEESGIFHPQNTEYVNTSILVKEIAAAHGKHIFLLSGFSTILRLLSKRQFTLNKLFGNLVYDSELSAYSGDYNIVDFKQSIMQTEKAEKV